MPSRFLVPVFHGHFPTTRFHRWICLFGKFGTENVHKICLHVSHGKETGYFIFVCRRSILTNEFSFVVYQWHQ